MAAPDWARYPVDVALSPLRLGQRTLSRYVNRFAGRRAHPVVLMHGFLGFNHFGPIEYFAGVREALEIQGFEAHAPTVNPLNRLEVRAYQWVYGRPPDADTVKESDPIFRGRAAHDRWVNPRSRPHLAEIYLRNRRPLYLITHSQGSLDARYLLSDAGLGLWKPFDTPEFDADLRDVRVRDMVSKVCTIAGPHNGILFADDPEIQIWLLRQIMTPAFETVVSSLSHQHSDATDAIREFGRKNMLEFNRTHPDPEGVELYSIAGVTNRFQVTFFLKPFFDQIHYNPRFEQDENDGLVPASSAKWPVTDAADIPVSSEPHIDESGLLADEMHPPEAHDRWNFLGMIYADHVDQIGIPFAIPRNHLFKHLRFYVDLADFLHGEFPDDHRLQENGTWGRPPAIEVPA